MVWSKQHTGPRNSTSGPTGRLLKSQSGNIIPRVGVVWGEAAGGRAELYLEKSITFPNLFTFTHDHSVFRF